MLRIVSPLALSLAAALVACGDANPVGEPGVGRSGDDAKPGPADGADAADGPDVPGGGADAGTPDSGSGTDAGTDAGDGDGGAGLEDLLGECGGLDLERPDLPLVDASFSGMPLTRKGTQTVLGFPTSYEVTLSPTLTMQASLVRSVTTFAATVTSAKPQLAQAKAQEEVSKRLGPTTFDLVPPGERGELGAAAAAWAGIVCTVQPGKRVTSALGSGTVVTEFSPPLPASISPRAEPGRYAVELQAPRTFSGIRATVTQSSDPAVAVGTTHTGTVTVQKIAKALEVTLDDGRKLTVGGDLGFEVRIDFGSPEITASLGLRPLTRYFVDTTRHVYKALVVDLEPGTSPAVFVAK